MEINDRELLELAAKAAGLANDWPAPMYDIQWNGANLYCSGNGRGMVWNPLTDDGDALRLAVKLDLLIDIGQNGRSQRLSAVLWPSRGGLRIHELHGADPYAATRRAIVRAAAEIAKGVAK